MSRQRNHTEATSATILLADNSDVESKLDRMKLLSRCETDAELAALIGITGSAIAQWRRRGAIPKRATLRFLNAAESLAA